LVGIWATEACEQASDDNGTLLGIWGKGLFEFSAQGGVTDGGVSYPDQGVIRLGHITYSDSNCVVVVDTRSPADTDPLVRYQDLGEAALQEGVPGHGLIVAVTAPGSTLSANGFYTLTNGRLCFSDMFTFAPFNFDASEAGSTAIDFGNCLVEG
jgi:hypothetical protein